MWGAGAHDGVRLKLGYQLPRPRRSPQHPPPSLVGERKQRAGLEPDLREHTALSTGRGRAKSLGAGLTTVRTGAKAESAIEVVDGEPSRAGDDVGSARACRRSCNNPAVPPERAEVL